MIYRFLTRRRFLQSAAGTSVAAALPSVCSVLSSSVDASPLSLVKNRAPLAASAFYLLPLGQVKPKGWLLKQLQIQADGLTGHLENIWPDVGANSGWLGGSGESWERGPYYVDGLIPLAVLLDDADLKAKAYRFTEWTLTHQSPDGMIGPQSNNDWWPRMVMVKALAQHFEATEDPRVVPVLTKYFHHQLESLPHRPLESWGKYRWQDEVLVLEWLFNRTGDLKLLDLARLLRQQGFNWAANFTNFQFTERCSREALGLKKGAPPSEKAMATHGVNNAQALKAGPVSYLLSSHGSDANAILQQLKMLDEYHGLPNGMFSADEHLAGRNPSQGIELCAVVEQMFSLEQSLAILGLAELGDRLEKIAYNALPAALTDDMRAHQYNQEPNQVECSVHDAPWTTDGPESNLFGLEPNFGCCTANYHQGWPKFTASLWMASADDGLVAAVYGPSEANVTLGGTNIHVVEETDYPFRGKVNITVNPAQPVSFPLRLRIPSWAVGTTVKVNGEPQESPSPGSFARVVRHWQAGDKVEVDFPMHVRAVPGYRESVSLERGPLVFSHPIKQDWLKLRERGFTADWQVYPASAWNYALTCNEGNIAGLTVSESAPGDRPFAEEGTSVTLQVSARRLVEWRDENGVAAGTPQSPVTTAEPMQTIHLIPYAAAKLRITSFPRSTV
jgi:hypothetical protein